ncbi:MULTISPECIES: hypothetical protein [unclassified Chelatococcus]|uniref:hypothetical protein n=1 Tax=unclassified Chelatococcus TaxID=2638111 RepID=UPI001BCD2D4F|nr:MULTISPECIES: hypothetical protein [unclassified Chelatococcus]MBS7695894.1 hypothetical protein [Chelatococcus sp. YT9]MBX3555731.1 hypothetical protein [Chelatococcus sp.]
MPSHFPPDLGRIVDRAFGFQPRDIRHVLDRIHAHALEPRMAPAELEAAALALGYSSVYAFGHAVGLPIRTIDAWMRLGVPQESAQLVRALLAMQDRFTRAAEELDQYTHVGLVDYLRDKRV